MTAFSSLVVVFLLCVASSYAVKVVDVETICKNVTNPSFCSTLLNSKPDASRDLVSLAEYTLNVVRANVTNTLKLINKLIAQSGSNEVARYHYQVCLTNFGERIGALSTIAYIQQLLKEKYYQFAYDSAADIEGDVNNCLTGESPSDPPYHDTSLLPKYANVIAQVGQIIVSILSYLMQA